MASRELILAAALACLTAAGCAKSQAKPVDPPPDEVLVALPTSGEITDYEDFIGHFDPVYAVEVRARVNGYLKDVNFKDGDEVEKGAVLFNIDDRPYHATFDNQTALVEQAKARYTRVNYDHLRAENLLQRTAIGREEYDRIQGDFAEAKAAIGAVKATLDMAQLNLDWTKVTAPISGRLSRRLVDPGNLVTADVTPLTTIVSLDPMYVYFDVDERTLLKIRRLIADGRMQSRTQAELPILIGLSDEQPNYPHTGTIDFSDNRLDASTGTLRLRGKIENPKPRLFSPGLFARVRLPIGKAHQSILVSEQAVGTDQGRKFVYVVQPGKVKVKDKKTGKETQKDAQVVSYRPIKVGALNNGMRVVDEGLKVDERVVVSGLQRVRPGKEVAPRMMADGDKGDLVRPSAKMAEAGGQPPVGSPPAASPLAATAPPAPPAPAATH